MAFARLASGKPRYGIVLDRMRSGSPRADGPAK
jgi:hypothetical protein